MQKRKTLNKGELLHPNAVAVRVETVLYWLARPQMTRRRRIRRLRKRAIPFNQLKKIIPRQRSKRLPRGVYQGFFLVQPRTKEKKIGRESPPPLRPLFRTPFAVKEGP